MDTEASTPPVSQKPALAVPAEGVQLRLSLGLGIPLDPASVNFPADPGNPAIVSSAPSYRPFGFDGGFDLDYQKNLSRIGLRPGVGIAGGNQWLSLDGNVRTTGQEGRSADSSYVQVNAKLELNFPAPTVTVGIQPFVGYRAKILNGRVLNGTESLTEFQNDLISQLVVGGALNVYFTRWFQASFGVQMPFSLNGIPLFDPDPNNQGISKEMKVADQLEVFARLGVVIPFSRTGGRKATEAENAEGVSGDEERPIRRRRRPRVVPVPVEE